jgi:hypothetical protein
MSQTVSPSDSLVVGAAEAFQAAGSLQWMSPVMLGLAGPVALISVLGTNAFEHAQFLFTLVLMTVMIISAVVFAMSALFRGPVAAMVFDRSARNISVVRQGVFANTQSIVPFDQVLKVQFASHYDDDGYRFETGELITTEGSSIELPDGVAESQVRAIKAILSMR